MAKVSYRKIGHKGADTIAPGNTLESFEIAVEHGVDMIEFDVLRDREGRFVIAHDYGDAASRRPLGLIDALDAFCQPPLDEIDFNLDLKLPGREAEVAGALSGHGLVERASVSTMEVESIVKLRRLEPELRIGWTVPKTRRDWVSYRWAGPAVAATLAAMRNRMPKTIASKAPELGVTSIWAYHRLVTPRLVEATREAGLELMAWTVDEADRIAKLAEMGVQGIVSNDPRLFNGALPAEPEPEREREREPETEKTEKTEKPEKSGKG
jgi:glycerophosphoryl diester phosphodiesterase